MKELGKLITPWYIRKVCYAGASIFGIALVAFGIVDPATIDRLGGELAPLVSIIVAAVGGMAAVRTNKDSDDRRPVVDIETVIDLINESTHTGGGRHTLTDDDGTLTPAPRHHHTVPSAVDILRDMAAMSS